MGRQITHEAQVAGFLQGRDYWKGWERASRVAARRGRASAQNQEGVEVDFSKFTPDRYLLSWTTAVAGVEPLENGYWINPAHAKWVNDNGNAWLNQVLLENYKSFIWAENFVEHVQLMPLSKGKILDAVAWVLEEHVPGQREKVPTVFIDALVATNKKKHPKLVQDIQSGKLNGLSMGCIRGDQRVLVSTGYQSVSSLVGLGSEVIQTPSGTGSCLGFISQGRKGLVRVKTATGANLYVSRDHRFRVWVPSGRLVWKRAEDLLPEDHLLSQKGDGGLIPESRGSSEDFWFSTGLLYGDGCRWEFKDGSGYYYWCGDRDLDKASLDRLENWLRLEGDFRVRAPKEDPSSGPLKDRGNNRLEKVLGKSSELDRILPDFKLRGSWRCSGVPVDLWNQGRRQIAAFLRGHWSADGGIYENRLLSLTTKQRALAQDHRRLLLLLGIVSTIRRRAYKTNIGFERSYVVEIKGTRSKERFAELVGFEPVDKAVDLKRIIAGASRKLDLHGVPHAGRHLRRVFPGALGESKWDKKSVSTLRHLLKGSRHLLSEGQVEGILAYAQSRGRKSSSLRWFSEFSGRDWWLDRVVAVLPWGEAEVFDPVEVSGGHSYVSEGVVSHNCNVTWTQCSRCGEIFKEDHDSPCEHVQKNLGKIFRPGDGRGLITAELCGVPDRIGSCEFIELSWVAVPAFRPAVRHDGLKQGDAWLGKPLRAYVPSKRYKGAAREV